MKILFISGPEKRRVRLVMSIVDQVLMKSLW